MWLTQNRLVHKEWVNELIKTTPLTISHNNMSHLMQSVRLHYYYILFRQFQFWGVIHFLSAATKSWGAVRTSSPIPRPTTEIFKPHDLLISWICTQHDPLLFLNTYWATHTKQAGGQKDANAGGVINRHRKARIHGWAALLKSSGSERIVYCEKVQGALNESLSCFFGNSCTLKGCR